MTSLDVSPSSVRTRRSQLSCASLRLCSSRAFELPCFSHWVLSVVFRETNGRGEGKSKAKKVLAPHSNSPRVGPTVVVALLEVCQGSVGGCEALDVLVAVVEVARAGRQSASGKDHYRVGALCSETQFSKRHSLWPRRWAELHIVDLKR